MTKTKHHKKSNLPIILMLILILLAGVAAAVYPFFADRYTEATLSKVQTEYEDRLDDLTWLDYANAKVSAKEWNRKLFEKEIDGNEPEENGYYDELDLTGTGIMGYIDIPRIDLYLPIYHGTDESTLSVGVGHIYQTSLPVGGENTHCVLSAHTGMASAPMFTDLELLTEGDYFFLHVLDETMAYQVDQILVVLPEEVDYISIYGGQDYVTLITCTPYGINSHRLLVRGMRVDMPDEETLAEYLANTADTGSVFWSQYIKGLLIGLLVAFLLLVILLIFYFSKPKKKKKKAGKTNSLTGMSSPERKGAASETTAKPGKEPAEVVQTEVMPPESDFSSSDVEGSSSSKQPSDGRKEEPKQGEGI